MNIEESMNGATSTPEEAAQNISTAGVFGIKPTNDKETMDELRAAARPLEAPKEAEQGVAGFVNKTHEHAALAKPDVKQMNWVEKRVNYIGDQINDRQSAEEEAAHLGYKKMSQDGQLETGDDDRLWQLTNKSSEMNQTDYGLTPTQKMPLDAAGDLINMAQTAGRGALEGFHDYFSKRVVDPKLDPLADQGLSGRMALGGIGFTSMLGKMYNSMPSDMPEATKRDRAYGASVVGYGLMFGLPVAGKVVAGPIATRLAPLIGRLTPELIATTMKSPAMATFTNAITNIGSAYATLAGIGAATEATNIVTEEMGKNDNTTNAGLINSIESAAQKLNEHIKGNPSYAERIATSANRTGLMGAFPSAIVNTAMAPGEYRVASAVKQIRDMQGYRTLENSLGNRVLPGENAQNLDTLFDQYNYRKKVLSVGEPVSEQHTIAMAMSSLDLHETLHQINDVMNTTRVSQLAPAQRKVLLDGMFKQSGVNKMWITASSLKIFNKTDEGMSFVKQLMGGNGILESLHNAPILVDPATVMDVARSRPDLLDHIMSSPEAPSALQAKTHLENIQNADKTRANLLSRLGIKPEDVKPEASSNVQNIPGKEKVKPTPYNFEEAARKTQSLLDSKKVNLDQIEKQKANLEAASAIDEERGATGIDQKTLEKQTERAIKRHEQNIANIDKDIEALKGEVTAAMKNPAPAQLLFGHWAEPGITESNQAIETYAKGQTFSDVLRSKLPKAMQEAFDKARDRAKEDRVNNIKEAARYEMNKVQDIHAKELADIRKEEELAKLEADPKVQLVENFKDSFTKGKSRYQIDPKTLTDEQVKLWLDNPRLKELKVFKKDAQPVNDVAQYLGATDANELLHTLANMPDKADLLKARVRSREAQDALELRNDENLNHVKVIENIRDRAKNHLLEMKFMKDNEWSAVKKGIKVIARRLPTIEEIEAKARDQVKKTPIGKLDPRQYEVGESRSDRLALDLFLKGDFAGAFEAKEEAAMNAALRKETMIQIARTNRAIDFARKFNKKETQQILKDAGSIYVKASDEIRDLWNLSPSKKGMAEIDSYNKYVKSMVDAGKGDFSIPEDMRDTRASIYEMTPEQVLVVHDRLKMILNQAKLKNKLMGFAAEKLEDAKLEDQDRVAQLVISAAQEHPMYREQRGTPIQGNWSMWQRFDSRMGLLESAITAKQYYFRTMDRGVGGLFYDTFEKGIEGSGDALNKSGRTLKYKLTNEVLSKLKLLAEKHGDFDSFEKTRLFVSEFKDIKELQNGKLTKADIFTAYMNFGQEYTKDLLLKNNGGLDEATWHKVFEQHLTRKDTEYAHGIFEIYRSFKPLIKSLQDAYGRDVDFIEGIGIKHGDDTNMGGYIRARHVVDYTKEMAKEANKAIGEQDAAFFERNVGAEWGYQYASDTTHQGYLKARKGTDSPISLSMRGLYDGMFEIIHDLSYRRPLNDFFDMINRDDVRGEMSKAFGQEAVDHLINANLKIAGEYANREKGWHTDVNRFFKRMFDKVGRNASIALLWGKESVIIKQFEAIPEMLNHLGPGAGYHWSAANLQMLMNLNHMPEFVEIAKRLDPSIQKYVDMTDLSAINSTHKILPLKARYTLPDTGSAIADKVLTLSQDYGGKIIDPIKVGGDLASRTGFLPITGVDMWMKVAQAHTIYRMIMADEHPYLKFSDIRNLPKEEQLAKIQQQIQQSSTLTMIQQDQVFKAPIQDNPVMKLMLPFWNYIRNILNNRIYDIREVKWNTEAGIRKLGDAMENASDEQLMESAKSFGTASTRALQMMVWSYVGTQIVKQSHRGFDYLTSGGGMNMADAKRLEDHADNLAKDVMLSPMEQMAEATPVLGAMKYGIEHKRRYGNVEINFPLLKAAQSAATCWSSVTDAMQLVEKMSDIPTSLSLMGNARILSCLEAEAYTGIAIPPKPTMSLYRWLNDLSSPSNAPAHLDFKPPTAQEMHETAKKFAENPPAAALPAFVAGVAKFAKDIAPDAAEVPPGTDDAIKSAMSKGDWSAPDGLYGFTPEGWKDVQTKAPDLALTDNGRTSKNTEQQEKAIQWELSNNTKELARKDIPVNKSTLFGAHRIGLENYGKLFDAASDEKVKNVLGDALNKYPDLAGLKTVGQVKKALNSQVEANKLTVAQ